MITKLFSPRPMPPRDAGEAHRAATPLELLFDLVSVIAIAAAAAGLHHAIAEHHVLEGLVKYAATFFAIWWAWMNYTWFASAYDNDDALFRILTMVIMSGALVMAAGIEPFFASMDLHMMVVGFVVMRLAMVSLWLRAAYHDPAHRTAALRYAGGIALAQMYWVGVLLCQDYLATPVFYAVFALGAVLELAVPVVAERQRMTTWHRHHIIERYGLLNIIVLGETVLSGSMALGKVAEGYADIALVHMTLSALVIMFSLWWLYFSKEDHLQTNRLKLAITWGYGHLLIYASGAAVGAGFAVLVDIITHHAEVGLLVGDYAVAVPVALYMFGLWFVRDRFVLQGPISLVLPMFGIVTLVAPLAAGLEGVATVTLLSVIVRSRAACRQNLA